MDLNYLKWPAQKGDLISVVLHISEEPVWPHKHDFIEIVYISAGSCLHRYRGTVNNLMPGDVFVIVPHEEHSYDITAKTVIYNFLFYPEALGDDWKKLRESKGIYDFIMVEPFFRNESKCREILHLSSEGIARTELIFKHMLEEQESRQMGFQLVQKANLLMLLALIGRTWENQFRDASNAFGGKRQMLAEALVYIENNFNAELKVDELASRFYLSPNYFRRIFRELTGLSPIEYINKLRISKACRLLSEEGYNISMVAEMVGFTDVNYFSRLFRLVTGLSPSEFKKKNILC